MWPLKIRQNAFLAAQDPAGELTTLHRPLVGWVGGIPPHTLPHSMFPLSAFTTWRLDI